VDLRRAEGVVADIGAARRGIVRVDLATASGVTGDDLEHLRRRGVVVSLGRGVDRLRDRPFDWESQCQAALDLAGRGAALGLRTGGRLRGFYAYRAADDVEVLVVRGHDQRTSVGRIVQTRSLPDAHLTVVDGFPVTTAARTFFDLCGDPDPGVRYASPYHERRMRQVYNDALGRRGMTFTQEAAVLLVQARRGRRGTKLVRETLLHYGPQHVPNDSDTSTLFDELVRTLDIPEPERQAPVSGPDGFIGVVDFLWPAVRHVVEVDSSWHDGPRDREEDALRDKRLEAAGYTWARYRYGDIIRCPDRIRRELGVATGALAPVATPNSVRDVRR
jgi:hypothetical protein